MTPALPTVLVFYALGSAGPAEIVEAADGLCEVVLAVDSRQPHTKSVLPFVEELAETLDLAGRSAADVAEQVRGRVHGVVTYSEFMLGEAAAVADLLGLPFHSPEVVVALTDKARQRTLLNERGVTPVRQVTVRGPEDFDRAVREVGLPVVIKPVRGTASVDVYRCTTAEDVAAIAPSADPGGWVVEEMVPPGRHPGAPWLGDYCSVETAVSDGECWHFAIVERLPPSPPFRESGHLVPDSLPGAYRDEVLAVAEAAIHAVGMTTGIAHVEVKFAPDGPRVIEVNGRLGGTTGRLLRRSSDLDPVRLALWIALGRRAEPRKMLFDRCVLAYRVLPPMRPVTVRSASRPAPLLALPGVWAVDGGVRSGQALDWRRGGLDRVYTVWVDADHPDALPPILQNLAEAAGACVEYHD